MKKTYSFKHVGKRKGDIKNIYRTLFYRWLVKKFLKRCKTVLDIGAGSGIFYDTAKKLGKKVQGIDLNDKNIRDNIVKMDYRKLNKHFDCCFNSQLIEHVDPFEFMKVMEKYCDKILITITVRPCTKFWDNPDHIRPYTTKAMRLLHRDHGFKTIFAMNLYPTKSFIAIGKKIRKRK
ncbi:methyltransferase domain-containing protein [Candidatus Woesearchaeota archaeon]|jgi:hypothetical protein|nr:methyltransferase domain-containing protein [Candidatus Woesearchaeota archaeon]